MVSMGNSITFDNSFIQLDKHSLLNLANVTWDFTNVTLNLSSGAHFHNFNSQIVAKSNDSRLLISIGKNSSFSLNHCLLETPNCLALSCTLIGDIVVPDNISMTHLNFTESLSCQPQTSYTSSFSVTHAFTTSSTASSKKPVELRFSFYVMFFLYFVFEKLLAQND